MKAIEALLQANEQSMLQIYFEGGIRLRVVLIEFDAQRGDCEVDERLSLEADPDTETIEELLAILEKQAEVTLREKAAEGFWKAHERQRD